MNGLPPGFELDEEPTGAPDYAALYAEADRVNGLPPGMTASIAGAETGHIRDDALRNRVRSPANAYGRMQFIPETGKRYGLNSYEDLINPIKSIDAAGRYLGDLYRQFGRPDLTAAAYNAGEHRQSLREGRIPAIPETQNYVKKVMKSLGSSQHVASMRERYAPNLFQRAAGGLFDAMIPPAQAADQPPPGNGVMLPAGFEVDPAPTPGGLPPGFELDDAPQAPTVSPAWQTAIRSTAKGLTAFPGMVADAINSPYNLVAKGVNTLRPGTMDYLAPTGQLVDRGLRAVGVNPEPASNAERAVTAGLSAATGAGLSTAAALPAWAAAPGKQVLGAMSASGASDLAREAGAPVPVQIGAGIVGGMVPGVVGTTVEAVGRGTARLGNTLTPGGRDKIAGRILNKQAAAPYTAIARAQDPQFNRALFPDSPPTLAEVTQDPGLAGLQRALPSTQIALEAGVHRVNAARRSTMDNAIRETLDRVNKVPKNGANDVLEKIGQVKSRIGRTFEQQMRDQGIDPADLAVPTISLENKLAELARKHQGNAKLEKLIQATQAGIEGGTNFTRLWNNRQSLDDLIYENLLTATAGSKADMKRLGQDIRSAMNDDLIAAVPEFKPFLDRYSRMARAEGRLRLGRDLVAKSETTARGIADEDQMFGNRLLAAGKFDKMDLKGAEAKAGVKLSKPQRQAFQQAQIEARRSNILGTGDAPGNSQTAQNLAINQIISDDIISGILGDNSNRGLAGLARGVFDIFPGRAIDPLTRAAQADVMRRIQAGLVDPEEGARLMEMGRLRAAQAFMPSLESGARTGVLSEIYNRMGRR